VRLVAKALISANCTTIAQTQRSRVAHVRFGRSNLVLIAESSLSPPASSSSLVMIDNDDRELARFDSVFRLCRSRSSTVAFWRKGDNDFQA
jgi:hypothetical protein